jgi:hypothetical protein
MQDVKNACMILNTAEYCQSTSLQVSLVRIEWTEADGIAGRTIEGKNRRTIQGRCIVRDRA